MRRTARTSDALHETILDHVRPKTLKKSDRTRISILRATVDVLARFGFDLASYEEIAKRAKVTRPLVQHYFPNREELFSLTVKLIRAEFQETAVEAIKSAKDPKQMLERYIAATFKWVEQKPNHARAWLFYLFICTGDTALRREHANMTRVGEERIAHILGLMKTGAVPTAAGMKKLSEKAKAVQMLITGGLIELATEHEPSGGAAVCERVTKLCFAVI